MDLHLPAWKYFQIMGINELILSRDAGTLDGTSYKNTLLCFQELLPLRARIYKFDISILKIFEEQILIVSVS